MDDQIDDRNPGIPPSGTPEELEEALKWLEELTARQGKTAEVKNQSATAALDSPFRGLIDSEDGDMPDWLREVPKTHDDNLQETEPESRLDWLSKMAQRESIEELPTLEWRRLSEPTQSAILAAQADNLPADLQFETDEDFEDFSDDLGRIDEDKLEVLTGEIEETKGRIVEFPLVISYAETQDKEESVPAPAEGSDEEIESSSDLVAPAVAHELAEAEPETAESEPDDYSPLMDDLDAAMAWIEELAASQDAPIEEIPSVANRALASKLMMEAGLTPIVSPLDELGSETSLLDSLTPTHPFIEEEDFADTIVLVETLAADQEEEAADFPTVREEVEVIEPAEGDVVESALETSESVADEAAAEELSFEEAMTYLDEIAGQQEGQQPGGPQSGPPTVAFEPNAATSEEPTDGTDAFSDEPIVEAQGDEGVEVERHFAEDEITVDQPIEEPTVDDQLITEPAVEADVTEDQPVEDADAEVGVETFVAEQRSDAPGDGAALWVAEETEPDSLSAADVPWLDSVVDVAVVGSIAQLDEPELDSEPISAAADAGNGQGGDELEATLLSLDALALPSGKSLEEISTHLRAAHTSSWRDVDSALDWLEAALLKQTAVAVPDDELDDIDLLERMPDDPDAVLAWLEQMAAEEEQRPVSVSDGDDEPSDVITTPQQTGSFVEELAEADLLNMPDDPDEAMVWLESLAQGRGAVGATPAVEADVPTELPQPEFIESVEPVVVDIETADEAESPSSSFEGPSVAMDDIDSEVELPYSSEAPVEDDDLASEYVAENQTPTSGQVEVDTPFDPLGGLSEDDLDLILGSESERVSNDVAPAVTAIEVVEEAPEPPAMLVESPTPEMPEAAQTAEPARKRGRPKSATRQEEPQTSEPPTPTAPEPERASPSWVDLLKPLE